MQHKEYYYILSIVETQWLLFNLMERDINKREEKRNVVQHGLVCLNNQRIVVGLCKLVCKWVIS